MAKSTFVSGQLKVQIAYNDRSDKYHARVCPMIRGETCDKVTVGPPRSGSRSRHGKRLSVDDPRALAQAAKAAIAFSRLSELAEYGKGGFRVRPPKRRRRR